MGTRGVLLALCLSSLLLAPAAWLLGAARTGPAGQSGPGPAGQAEPVKPKQLKVLTYNINYGMPEQAATLKAILAADADIVCLQETQADWEDYLRRNLARKYPVMLFKNSSAHPAAGLAVFTKFPPPIKLKAFVKPADSWGPAMLVQADTPIGPVQVMNLHLRPPPIRNGELSLNTALQTLASHKAEVEKAFELCKPQPGPLLVMGDFNEGDDGPAMTWLTHDRKMSDGLAGFDKLSPTWHWKLGDQTLAARLDHIVFADLKCVAAKVTSVQSSDHYPVEAVFEKQPPTSAPASQP